MFLNKRSQKKKERMVWPKWAKAEFCRGGLHPAVRHRKNRPRTKGPPRWVLAAGPSSVLPPNPDPFSSHPQFRAAGERGWRLAHLPPAAPAFVGHRRQPGSPALSSPPPPPPSDLQSQERRRRAMEMRSGKRMRSSPTDTDGSRSPSPYRRSSSPSPSPYRSPSPSPCRSWSQRPPSYDDAYDDEDRSLSRSRGSDGNDAQGRAVWRPHSSRQSGERGHGGEFSVRIDDYDRLFTCRSCRRLLIPPVYQCPFSHVTCSRCHDEFGDNRCSSCGATNGYARNRAVEEFLWRISFSCRNKEYGCTTFLPQHEVRAHEQSCRHEPCFCPVDRCGFAGPTNAVEAHLTGFHHWRMIKFRYGESFIASAPKSTIYHSKDDDELFLIDSFGEGRGIAMSMICLRCDNACEQEFTYELKTPPGNVRGHHQLQLQSMVRRTSLRKGLGEKDKVFLLVPKELLCAMNDYVVEVCVRKEDTGA